MYIRSRNRQNKMLQILYKYLALNKRAVIPGVGAFYIHRKPATLDFSNKAFIAPTTKILFDESLIDGDKNFYSFIAKEQQIEEGEAVQSFNQFSKDLKENLQTNRAVQLPGVGLLTKDGSGKVVFQPVDSVASFYPNVSVEREISEVVYKEQVVVESKESDDRIVETEMAEVEPPSKKKDYWWLIAALLAVVAIAAIIYYYNENGSFR